VSWCVSMGLTLEAIIVGHARGVLVSALVAVLQQLGPTAMDASVLQYIASKCVAVPCVER
jgi:hypothetical protein